MRRHEPELYGRIASVLLPKDYVRLRLCGEKAMDVADASGTLLFDVARRRWASSVLDALELDEAWLPRDARVARGVGRGRTACRWPPVRATRRPARSAWGWTGPGPASVVLGTSGVVFVALEEFAADPEARAAHVLPRGARRLARDGRDALGGRLAALAARRGRAGRVVRRRWWREAERWEPGAEGLTFLPYLSGERTPHADPDARGAFAGLSVRHDRGALVRAVLEGVAYGLRDCLDLLVDVGAAPTVGRVSGGGARSDLWLRIVASVLELPLERTAVDEGAAFGAALLGGVAGGVWSSVEEAVAATVRPTDVVEPVDGLDRALPRGP